MVNFNFTEEQYKKAAEYVDDMFQHRDRLYWLNNRKKGRKQLIEEKLASLVFYDICHENNAFGQDEIIDYLSKGKMPKEIIESLIIAKEGSMAEWYCYKFYYYNKLSPVACDIVNKQTPEKTTIKGHRIKITKKNLKKCFA